MKTCLLLLALSLPASAATLPATTATALDGHTVTLPRDLTAPATILILGFTHASSDPSTAWEKSIHTSLATSPSIAFYDMPVLQDAPAFVRPLILRGIRKQVPDALKPRFLPLTSNEAAWKLFASFSPSAADAAYILLVDRSGSLRWQTHAPLTPTLFNQLSTAARQLAAESR
jgi:hypothetical protein